MKAIGLDIGTTSICGVLLDVVNNCVIESKTINSNAFVDSQYVWEKIQDVNTIYKTAKGILDELVDEDTVVIGVTGQMHGIVYVDEGGNAVSPLYTWQDGRGNLTYENSTYAKKLKSFSGYGNVTDYYNRINSIRPDQAKTYCTIGDYIVMRLTDNKVPIMHISNAASLGCFNIKTKQFSYPCDIKISEDYETVGHYRKIPVSIAIGDNQASVLGAGTSENDVLVNVGTGSQVSVISNKIMYREGIEVRPYFDNKYLIVGAPLCGGRSYSMLKDFFKNLLLNFTNVSDDKIYDCMASVAKTAEFKDMIVDTRFAGTRIDPGISGSISNINISNFNPGELTYAMLSGIATELLDIYKNIGEPKKGLIGSGNGIRNNELLVSIFEDAFGLKMRIPEFSEEAAVGAIVYALNTVGLNSYIDSSKK